MEIIFNFQHPSQNPLLLKFCRNNKYTLMHLLILELFHLVFDSETSLWLPLWLPLKIVFYLILTYSYYFLDPKLSSTMFKNILRCSPFIIWIWNKYFIPNLRDMSISALSSLGMLILKNSKILSLNY